MIFVKFASVLENLKGKQCIMDLIGSESADVRENALVAI